jgi:hypothetical protein
MKKNEMGRARSAYGEEERCIGGVGRELEGKRRLGRPRHRSKAILELILKIIYEVAYTGLMWL